MTEKKTENFADIEEIVKCLGKMTEGERKQALAMIIGLSANFKISDNEKKKGA